MQNRTYDAKELDSMSEEVLEKLYVTAQRSDRNYLNFNVLSLSFIIGGTFCAVAIATGQLAALSLAIAAVAIACFINTFIKMSVSERLSNQLRPLADLPDDTCAQALALVKRSPVAQAWVKSATTRGRQLRMFDYVQMQHLTIKAENDKTNLKRKQVCNELHGITDSF